MLTYPQIDPVIFAVGPIEFRWYSLMYVIGLVFTYGFLQRAVRVGTLPLSRAQAELALIWAMTGMLVGARVTYIFVYNWDYYRAHLNEIFSVWYGGLSFHGALIGIALALAIFCRRRHLSLLNVTDHIATIAPVGLGFGRIGNFINDELWGRVTTVPWAMVFPTGGPFPRHPSQLYESFGEGWLLLAFMMWLYGKRPRDGVLSGAFFLGYGTIRFVLEFFREPDPQLGPVLGPFSMGQVLCALMWVFGAIILAVALRTKTLKQSAPM